MRGKRKQKSLVRLSMKIAIDAHSKNKPMDVEANGISNATRLGVTVAIVHVFNKAMSRS